jgi:hypothetical protein
MTRDISQSSAPENYKRCAPHRSPSDYAASTGAGASESVRAPTVARLTPLGKGREWSLTGMPAALHRKRQTTVASSSNDQYKIRKQDVDPEEARPFRTGNSLLGEGGYLGPKGRHELASLARTRGSWMLGICYSVCIYYYYYYYYYYLLTAIGLMPGGSVTKIGRTYKKWTYIARKQNIHLAKKQHISQNFTVQYKCNEQNIRYNK